MTQVQIDSLDQVTQLPPDKAAPLLEREVTAEREHRASILGQQVVAAADALPEDTEEV